ncbi:MAG: phosphatase PAP2 family protein [Pseudomonadota bacterium]
MTTKMTSYFASLTKTPFSFFLTFSIVYLLFATILLLAFWKTNADALNGLGTLEVLLGNSLLAVGLVFLATLVFLVFMRRSGRLLEMSQALLATCIFLPAFGIVKSSMPLVWDFYADPIFAAWDYYFHLESDAYVVYAKFFPIPSPEFAALIYGSIWAKIVAIVPGLVALIDSSNIRKWRFVWMVLLVWVGLGNITALLGLSVGPIFYEHAVGVNRYDGLYQFFEQVGYNRGVFDEVAQYLWQLYATNTIWIGSGISAFPSVHVAAATLIALYLFDLNRFLGIVGIAYVMLIQVLSVYSGFHYAIDGYFSILVVTSFWIWHRRRYGT